MPPLKAEFTEFKKLNRSRLNAIEAKERAAANFADTLLLREPTPSKSATIGRSIMQFVTGKRPINYAESRVAVYDAGSGDRTELVGAFVTSHALFTWEVAEVDESGLPQLGVLQPRAAFFPSGTRPLMALDKTGNPVFPDTMTLDQRETFVSDVQETLTSIGCVTDGPTFQELRTTLRTWPAVATL